MKKILKKEMKRLILLNKYEDGARAQGFQFIAGIDEAGRGPLAGPVVAAACIIPEGVYFPKIDDSKKLKPEERQDLFQQIMKDERVIFGIGIIEPSEIDRVNIYQATIHAMLQAITKLGQMPDYLLVDGMRLPHPTIPSLKIIKGDSLSQSIAAASVIAKETRDRLMVELHSLYPEYGFEQHKGYATPQHLEALEKYGPCKIHRRSFEPCKEKNESQLLIPF